VIRRTLGHLRGNLIALVALFFALTGGALAATKYLTASDTIPAGDLAGSTYGDPVINNGAVSNAKLANRSLTISAGTGLSGGGSIALGGSGTLSVDPTVTQNRVSGSCSSGSAIDSINQDGSVTCQDAGPSTAFAVGSPEGAGVGLAAAPNMTTVLSKSVPAGSYVINAKTTLANVTASAPRSVACQIGVDTLNTLIDQSAADLTVSGGGDDETIPLQGTATFAGPTTVSLSCRGITGSADDVFAFFPQLTLIKVGSLS
jgi:hypothetical protein